MSPDGWTPDVVIGNDGRRNLRIAAPLLWKAILAPAALLLGLALAVELWRDWPRFSDGMHILGPVAAGFLLVASIEYCQRVYLFSPDLVRLRILWMWRTVRLPNEILIEATDLNEIVIQDASNGRRCLRIPKDFTRSGALSDHLAAYYREWRRLGEGTMSGTQKQVSRRLAVVFLILSLAIAAVAGGAFLTTLAERAPRETEAVTGVVRDVHYGHGKYGNVTSVGFRIGEAPRTFLYMRFFPSFEQAKECLVAGGSVTVLASAGAPSEIWSLHCADGFMVGPNDMLAARRANGRFGGWLAIGFLIASAFWVWLIASGRAA